MCNSGDCFGGYDYQGSDSSLTPAAGAPPREDQQGAELNKVELPVAAHLESWLDAALAEVGAVMRERGAKYGPGNIAEFGELGVLVRLSDKLARLRHSSGKDFADERARDAWLDIIGYGLIGLAWADGNWPGSEAEGHKCGELVVSGLCAVCQNPPPSS